MTPERLDKYEAEIGTLSPMTEGQRFREVIAYARELEKDKARLDWINEQYKWDDEAVFGMGAGDVREAIDNANNDKGA